MKRILLPLALVLSLTSLHAQEQTLFSGKIDIGGYGGPMVQFTSVDNKLGVFVGGYGALLIDHTIGLGLGGWGLVNDIKAGYDAQDWYKSSTTWPYQDLYYEIGYGGGIIEYVNNSDALLHVTGRVLIGGGAVNYRYSMWNNYGNYRDYERPDIDSDIFFVVEPSVQIEMNITGWMRAQIGAGYRFVNGIDQLVGVTDKDLTGPSGMLTFKFGTF